MGNCQGVHISGFLLTSKIATVLFSKFFYFRLSSKHRNYAESHNYDVGTHVL